MKDKQQGLGPYYGMLALFVVIALVGIRQSRTPEETIRGLHDYATTPAVGAAAGEPEKDWNAMLDEGDRALAQLKALNDEREYTATEDMRRRSQRRRSGMIYLPGTTSAHAAIIDQEKSAWARAREARVADERRYQDERRRMQREKQEFIVQTRVEDQRLADQRAHELELARASAPVVNVEPPRGVACGPYGTDSCVIDVRIIR